MNAKCLAPCLFVLCVGCSLISVEQQNRYRDSEGYFEPSLLQQIQPGHTSGTWLLSHFGPPLVEHELANQYPANVRLRTWRFTHERQKETRVFLLFRSRNLLEQHDYLHVVTENDLVVRTWRDELESVDVRKVMSALGYKKVAGMPSAPAAPEKAAVPPPVQLMVEDVPPTRPDETPPDFPHPAADSIGVPASGTSL